MKNRFLKIRTYILASILSIASTLALESAYAEVIYGMGSHVGQGRTTPEQISNWLNIAQFKGTRDEVYWGDVEKTPHEFHLSGRAKTSLNTINSFEKNGLTPLVVLDYGNKNYDQGDMPYTDDGRAAFGRYAQFIATQTNSNIKLFEIWNEWNTGMGSKPRRKYGSPEDYVKLVAASSKAIRAVKPDAQIIGGSLADDLGGWPWLRQAISFGLLKYVDGVSIHLYNYSNSLKNGGDAEFIVRLEQLEKLLATSKPESPPKIYITEIGWPNHTGKGSVPLDISADIAARFLISSKSIKSLSGIWFYELMDGGTNPEDKEDHFGSLTISGTEKPLSCALRKLGPILNKLTLVSSESVSGNRLIRFKNQDGTLLTAIWQEEWNAKSQQRISAKSSSTINQIELSCESKSDKKLKPDSTLTTGNSPILLSHKYPLTISLVKHTSE